VVSQEGHILTAFHVVKDAVEIRIPGVNSPVALLATDPNNDLALLRVFTESPKTAVFRVPSQGVRLGESIILVGFPLQGLLSSGPTVTSGTVSALGGPRDDKRLFQITAPVQGGNSGGPVFDEAGQVIGMVLAKLDAIKVAMVTGDLPQNVNFALNGALIRAFLETNGVRFETGTNRRPLSHPEVAERAQQFVVLVENWQQAGKRANRE
jgi:S1-C subfamily serine protease